MNAEIRRSRVLFYIGFSLLLLFVWGCQPVRPLPQPRRVVDPSNVPASVRTPDWDIAAVGYEYYGQGINYAEAGLDPIYLVFKNKSQKEPVVLLQEVRGVAPDGEYLVYSVGEAERLVNASETFDHTAREAVRNGAMGAAVGAGLGALIGLLTGGNDRVWQGAIIGGAVGGVGGAVGTLAQAKGQLSTVVRQELNQYVWKESPIAPMLTRSGYLYMPGGLGIYAVKITVRTGKEVKTYKLPVDQAPAQYQQTYSPTPTPKRAPQSPGSSPQKNDPKMTNQPYKPTKL